MLNCTISGFDSNPPTIDYDWTLNDALIPHPHDQTAAAASMYSPAELVTSPKFTVSLHGTELSLVVNNPSTFTGMLFIFCAFIIFLIIA